MKIALAILTLLCSTARAGILFETDFSKDIGYRITNNGLFNSNNVPDGWTAAKAVKDGVIEVIQDTGIAAKPVLKMSWDPTLVQPTTTLLKHLTGNINTGHNELFIRYHIRLPENFRAGDGTLLEHWKWGRLWQNTAPQNPGNGNPGEWTENRVDSFYVVWNFNGTPGFTDINTAYGSNTGSNLAKGSAGGEYYLVDYFVSGATAHQQAGYFENVGNGSWDFFTALEDPANGGFLKNRTQTWHTIEFHFKLASNPTAYDGVFEVWFDGVKQNGGGAGGSQGWTRFIEINGAAQLPFDGLPTATNGGSGFNMFALFDNLVAWNAHWGDPDVDGFIYINDIVISDERIGHDYVVGQPSPPGNLRRQ